MVYQNEDFLSDKNEIPSQIPIGGDGDLNPNRLAIKLLVQSQLPNEDTSMLELPLVMIWEDLPDNKERFVEEVANLLEITVVEVKKLSIFDILVSSLEGPDSLEKVTKLHELAQSLLVEEEEGE